MTPKNSRVLQLRKRKSASLWLRGDLSTEKRCRALEEVDPVRAERDRAKSHSRLAKQPTCAVSKGPVSANKKRQLRLLCIQTRQDCYRCLMGQQVARKWQPRPGSVTLFQLMQHLHSTARQRRKRCNLEYGEISTSESAVIMSRSILLPAP